MSILSKKIKNLSSWLWDTWCLISIIGIWPRFIEPKLVSVTRLILPILNFPEELENIKIIHISDLHWCESINSTFVKKIEKKINSLNPDLILFTGDFLRRSKLKNPEGLKRFLCSLKASVGHFAVLGNHDYTQFVTVNTKGEYDIEKLSSSSIIVKGFQRLFSSVTLSNKTTEQAKQLDLHQNLIDLLNETPFQLLHNTSTLVKYRNGFINISGMGEYTLGQSIVDKTFTNYNSLYPGIILMHNPDAAKLTTNYPGDLILAGHTHGGQINLPLIWKKFTQIENPQWKRGLKKIGDKWLYISRGLGSIMNFRWFSMPEITLITLQKRK
ncbi:MAG: UDP-2,3-diacylglucosamine diphosphatase LpxG [Parachlamydiaceae bacterium]|nr:UDP-2,3-diacylglucosamine diphosphatase LpxG [Parachlamydiaceae bacterium]